MLPEVDRGEVAHEGLAGSALTRFEDCGRHQASSLTASGGLRAAYRPRPNSVPRTKERQRVAVGFE